MPDIAEITAAARYAARKLRKPTAAYDRDDAHQDAALAAWLSGKEHPGMLRVIAYRSAVNGVRRVMGRAKPGFVSRRLRVTQPHHFSQIKPIIEIGEMQSLGYTDLGLTELDDLDEREFLRHRLKVALRYQGGVGWGEAARLVCLEGLTTAEAARRMGRSQSWVYETVAAVVKRLRRDPAVRRAYPERSHLEET